MSNTLQLLYPQWQGGANPHYQIGAQVLSALLPISPTTEKVTVPVLAEAETNANHDMQNDKSIYGKNVLLKQQMAAQSILDVKQPDKIITLGGDCSISQVPFDYLHGHYPQDTAILWLDAHPDIMTPNEFDHEHAMVLGNLLGYGAPDFAKTVTHRFTPSQILYVGLVESGLSAYEKKFIHEHNLTYLTPQDIHTSTAITNWLKEHKIKQFMVHLDLDVLSPIDFRSLLCNKPHQGPVEYTVGEMKLAQVVNLLQAANQEADLVGLSIAEYLPWDIINLREQLGSLSIFK